MYKLKNNKAFTIIELLVVIAILGILVLLAMWGYKGYVEKAKLIQIRHDVKAAEQLLAAGYLAKGTSLPDNWVNTKPENSVNNIYDTKGLVDPGNIKPGNYKLFPKGEIGSKLPGNFHAGEDGKVYYEDNKITEDKPFSDDEIKDLIEAGFIPVANADELQRINGSGHDEDGVLIFEEAVWGAGTDYEGIYTGTLGSKYIQVQDIDLSSYSSWIPVGIDPGAPFAGEYNGGNFTISNFNITENTGFYSAGLFGSLGNADTVKLSNIKIDAININVSDNASVLVGDAGYASLNDLYIENIKITNANINSPGNVGGLTGDIRANNEVTIENILFDGNLTAGRSVGGLAFFVAESNSTIKDITIKGDILSTNNEVGGIIGQAYTNIDTIENILIEGNITGSGSSGGLIGFISKDTIGTIKDITIKGDILSTNNEAGGIIGQAYTNIDTIENILIEGNITGSESSGGLIGFISKDTTGTIIDITIKGNILSTNNKAGGITGEAYTNIETIENISIEGDVSGSGSSGGLFGYINHNEVGIIKTIKDITIKDDILSINDKAGGIIGEADINIDTIENILIEGDIIGKRNTGGLIGQGTRQLSNIYDVKIINSEINGIENSGGLFGSLYNSVLMDKVLIKDTVVKSDSSHSGGLAGEIVKLIASGITIENSNITGTLNTGGIAGVMLDDYSLSGINIDKNTTINGFGSGSEGTGGISGKVESTTSILDINISADITGVDNVGELYGWINSQGVIGAYSFDGILSGTGINIGGPYGYMYIPEE